MHKATRPDGVDVWIARAPGQALPDWIACVRRALSQDVDPATLCKVSDPWTDAEGNTHQVYTCRGPNETQQEMCDRHEEEVAAMQEAFPCV